MRLARYAVAVSCPARSRRGASSVEHLMLVGMAIVCVVLVFSASMREGVLRAACSLSLLVDSSAQCGESSAHREASNDDSTRATRLAADVQGSPHWGEILASLPRDQSSFDDEGTVQQASSEYATVLADGSLVSIPLASSDEASEPTSETGAWRGDMPRRVLDSSPSEEPPWIVTLARDYLPWLFGQSGTVEESRSPPALPPGQELRLLDGLEPGLMPRGVTNERHPTVVSFLYDWTRRLGEDGAADRTRRAVITHFDVDAGRLPATSRKDGLLIRDPYDTEALWVVTSRRAATRVGYPIARHRIALRNGFVDIEADAEEVVASRGYDDDGWDLAFVPVPLEEVADGLRAELRASAWDVATLNRAESGGAIAIFHDGPGHRSGQLATVAGTLVELQFPAARRGVQEPRVSVVPAIEVAGEAPSHRGANRSGVVLDKELKPIGLMSEENGPYFTYLDGEIIAAAAERLLWRADPGAPRPDVPPDPGGPRVPGSFDAECIDVDDEGETWHLPLNAGANGLSFDEERSVASCLTRGLYYGREPSVWNKGLSLIPDFLVKPLDDPRPLANDMLLAFRAFRRHLEDSKEAAVVARRGVETTVQLVPQDGPELPFSGLLMRLPHRTPGHSPELVFVTTADAGVRLRSSAGSVVSSPLFQVKSGSTWVDPRGEAWRNRRQASCGSDPESERCLAPTAGMEHAVSVVSIDPGSLTMLPPPIRRNMLDSAWRLSELGETPTAISVGYEEQTGGSWAPRTASYNVRDREGFQKPVPEQKRSTTEPDLLRLTRSAVFPISQDALLTYGTRPGGPLIAPDGTLGGIIAGREVAIRPDDLRRSIEAYIEFRNGRDIHP